MAKYGVYLTVDELSNVQSALEDYIERLSSPGEGDYDPADDIDEVVESAESALDAVNQTVAGALNL